MKFFVPVATDDANAETLYSVMVEFNNAPTQERRVFALTWTHQGEDMSCQVGDPAPRYYGTQEEPVLAILNCGALFKVCTPGRGGVRGEAIFVGRHIVKTVEYFE